MEIDKKQIIDITNTSTLPEALDKLTKDQLSKTLFGEKVGIVLPRDLLYHGSQLLVDSLQPNASDGGENDNKGDDLIYATDNAEYAIFLASLDLQAGHAGVYFDDNDKIHMWVDDDFQNSKSSLREGYLYVLDGEGFEKQDNHEFTYSKEIKPLFYIKVDKSDLVSELELK